VLSVLFSLPAFLNFQKFDSSRRHPAIALMTAARTTFAV
jgi:hypothetical protein